MVCSRLILDPKAIYQVYLFILYKPVARSRRPEPPHKHAVPAATFCSLHTFEHNSETHTKCMLIVNGKCGLHDSFQPFLVETNDRNTLNNVKVFEVDLEEIERVIFIFAAFRIPYLVIYL